MGREGERADPRERAGIWAEVHEDVLKGKYQLPFYGDFPAMPPIERKVTWNFMLAEESMVNIILDSYLEPWFRSGERPPMGYQLLKGTVRHNGGEDSSAGWNAAV